MKEHYLIFSLAFMDHLRSYLQHLRDGRPGRRFRDLYRRLRQRHRSASSARRLGRVLFGIALVVAGIFFMAVPGPGIPILLLGLVLLGTTSRRTARLLDRAEIFLRFAWRGVRAAWHSTSPLIRGVIILLAAAGVTAVGYGLLRMAVTLTVFALS